MTETGGVDSHLTSRMALAARELQDQPDPPHTFQAAVDLAVTTVAGCDAAAITITRRGGQVETPAASGPMAVDADRLQLETGEGPCLDAAWREEVVHSVDLLHDPRWPTWGPRVHAETGARSALCLRLFTHDTALGALNLFSLTPDGFDQTDLDDGLALAAHVAIAVVGAQQLQHLHLALDARTVTAQGIGMVMERYGLEAAQAFAVLTRVATTEQRKLRDIAEELVSTRHIPGVNSPGR